jgi:Putative polyhydroxyalkanoic acid system protein (PHA_gran_rgn)
LRITISHNRTKEEVVQAIDRSFNDLFQAGGGLPVKLAINQKDWQGSTLTFALTANLGFISSPIKGTIEVTDKEVIIDAELGMLGRFVSDKAAQDMIGSKIKGLLN